MSQFVPEILLTLYKIASLLTGLALCYMGYRLFMAGIWGSGGDLDAKFAKTTVVLKDAAPGVFFVLFGTVIITTTIVKGLELRAYDEATKELMDLRDQIVEDTLPESPPF